MLLITDAQTAFELAGVADAALSDGSRPVLGDVLVEVEQLDGGGALLRVVATDSHILGKREVIFASNQVDYDPDDTKLAKGEGIQINGKAWKKALKEAATGLRIMGIIILITADGVTVAREDGSAPEVALKAEEHGNFPKYRSLFTGELEHYAGALPSFNPELLGRVAVIATAKPSDRKVLPARMIGTVPTSTTNDRPELRPFIFAIERPSGSSFLEVLVMPMRVNERAR